MTDISNLVDALRALGPRATHCDEPKYLPPATDAALTALDTAFEGAAALPQNGGETFFLPAEYHKFLTVTSGVVAMDVHCGYALRMVEEWDSWQLHDWPRRLPAVVGGSLVLKIGGDGGGNLFLLALDDAGSTYKWHHDALSSQPETAAFEKLAPTFSGFLHRMVEDWTRLANGDHDWQYMSG